MANLLQRLELVGFKSFASKTVFDLSQGITAIVGPNGSGKSNIIDAVRWLLGEREAKNLRGVKSEDLIFAGTAKRPRMGQAQASLYFENVGNFFPVDFTEIVVTRQVNRDGTNQYFLNKSEIRLKDLIDFFASARLGTKGLIVVSQGNSDVFIQSTPQVRREMIEEMLGLREYQIKKLEAERRLKNTQINLDKVKALTEEILPHLRSLKRQTGRWARRAELEHELKDLENGFFGSEYHELMGKAAVLSAEIEGREKDMVALVGEREDASARVKQVEASQPEERRELHEIKRKTDDMQKKRSELQKELGRLEVQIELSAREVPGDTSDGPSPAALSALVRDVRSKLEGLLEDDIDPNDFHASIQEVIEDIDAIIEERRPSSRREEQPSGFEDELERITKLLTELEHDMLGLKEKEKGLEANQEAFYASFKSAVAALEIAKDKIDHWEAETQKRRFEKERLILHLDEWERQVRQAGRSPEEFHRTNDDKFEVVGDRGDAERKIFKLRGDLAAIGEIDEALLKEATETEERYVFLNKESEDLVKAKDDLRGLIVELNDKIKNEFTSALHKINDEFEKFFGLMFGGGNAKLKLTAPKPKAVAEDGELRAASGAEVQDAVKVPSDDEAEDASEGIEIDIKMSRKRITSLDMLSGGERSLVGIAALFALISVSPPPFLVLDEIDAALDERNARRFSEMLKEFSKQTQFILVTHNRATMEAADILYGITLADDGTSKAVSLKLESQAG